MDIGNQMRVIEVDDPEVAPEVIEEITIVETEADSPTPAQP